ADPPYRNKDIDSTMAWSEPINERAETAAPAGWSEPEPDRPVPLWASLRADIAAHRVGGPPKKGRVRDVLGVVVRSPGFHVTAVHRLAHVLAVRGGLAGRIAASGLFVWLRHGYGCSIAS